jgi:hypothetical protein
MQHAWAEALLTRYKKLPGDAEWATDPISSALGHRMSPELRQSVMRFAVEANEKRDLR